MSIIVLTFLAMLVPMRALAQPKESRLELAVHFAGQSVGEFDPTDAGWGGAVTYKRRSEMVSMTRGATQLAPALVALFSFVPASGRAEAPKPNFSGEWKLEVAKSDDSAKKIHEGMVDVPGNKGPMERQMLLQRLTQLAHALDRLEIKHTEKELQFVDEAANVRIYYIDGKKHPRQTPWGAKLQTVTAWEGDHLLVKTDGKDLGKIDEMYAFQGRELVYEVRVRPGGLKNEIVARSFYSRLESQ